MDHPIAYTVQDDMDRPLFGVSTRRERLLNLVVGLLTTVMVVFTFISAFVFPRCPDYHKILPHNIAFSACIALVCASLLILIYWYRQGDVDPKFRKMIYFNSVTIVLLCACANWYFIQISYESSCSNTFNNTSSA